MNKWQPFAQPVATLVLAGAVVFLGYQQGKPRNVGVSIYDMPDVSIYDMPNVLVDNARGMLGRRSLSVIGCGRY